MNQILIRNKLWQRLLCCGRFRERFSKIFSINLPTSLIDHRSLNMLSMSVKRYSREREDKLLRRSSYWGHWSWTNMIMFWLYLSTRYDYVFSCYDLLKEYKYKFMISCDANPIIVFIKKIYLLLIFWDSLFVHITIKRPLKRKIKSDEPAANWLREF